VALDTLDRPGDYIDGRFVSAADGVDGELRIVSPADLRDTTAIHAYRARSVDDAIDAARNAFPSWRRTARSEREACLRRYQARLLAHHASLTTVLAREVGKPLWEAKTEVDAMIAKVDLVLGEGARFTQDERIEGLPGEIRHRPLGVIAVIGPFNFPGHLPNGQFLPALLLGNTVVHKPSERTPSMASWLARCWDEAGAPPGVFNVVQGPGAFGATLASHPAVDGVMFTGSAEVGRRIVASQGARLDRLVALELGGKNASIVLDDCELERTARAITFSAFVTAGQRCTATSRLVVTRGVADALLSRVVELASNLRVGHPLSADAFMGPVISAESRARVLETQATTRSAGFEPLVLGGPCDVPSVEGHYLRPSIHRAPEGTTALPGYTDTELFGPDLAVHVVTDLEQALAVASDTRFGLSAAVFTANQGAFERAADELRVGVLHWNRPTTGASGRLPFGGVKDSGNHRPAGILAGTACAYPLGVLLPPGANEPLPTWPGMLF
jgi:succinylglutamic semialdehyde dehydrogenase